MKKVYSFITLCVLICPLISNAQFGNESTIPYFRYSVTFGVGPNQMYGDLDRRQIGPSAYVKGNYFVGHGISVGLELQEGVLRGIDSFATDGIRRRSLNFYHAAIVGVTFQPFKFFQDDHLRRIEYREPYWKRTLNSAYIGAGVGVLYSLQWDRNRARGNVPSNINGNDVIVEAVLPTHQGNNYGFSYLASTNVGFELPLHSLKPNLLDSYIWSLVVNAQFNFAFDDELDGYSGNYPGNENNDVYGFLSIGVNLRF